MPGSDPTETYAATVAARRTSGTSGHDRRPDRGPATPSSATGSRWRAVRIWSRRAIFATAAADAGRIARSGLRWWHPASLRSKHEQCRTRPRPRRRWPTPGIDPVAIETFAHYYRLLEHGETGMIPESSIEPLDMRVARRRRGRRRDARPPRCATTAVIKLNGGLGTSMGMDRAKSPALRAQRAVVPRRHRPAGAAPAPASTTPRCR